MCPLQAAAFERTKPNTFRVEVFQRARRPLFHHANQLLARYAHESARFSHGVNGICKWNIRWDRGVVCFVGSDRRPETASGNDNLHGPIRRGSGAAGTAVRGKAVMTNIPTELLRTLVAV